MARAEDGNRGPTPGQPEALELRPVGADLRCLDVLPDCKADIVSLGNMVVVNNDKNIHSLLHTLLRRSVVRGCEDNFRTNHTRHHPIMMGGESEL